MEVPSWLNADMAITVVSAVLAAVAFAGFALPLIIRSEKKKRYRDIIEKKRRSLFEQSKHELKNRSAVSKDNRSAAQSMAALHLLQRLAGDASTQARNLMLRAGIRSPTAPLIYLVSRIVLPVAFLVIAMLFISAIDKEISEGMTSAIVIGSALFGFFLPRLIIKNTADKRQEEIQLSFPDALDMMLICVQGGIGIEAAINKIADEISEHSETLAEEMGLLSAELGMLNDRRSAFQGFATRVGSGAGRSFATSMMQAEQYGTSVTKAMRVLAEEQREIRMAAAEQKAASLPPKLTVPMILFFLPALFVVILGPAFLASQ